MTRWCATHQGNVRDNDAQVIGGTDTGSGPARPVYACITCIRTHGHVPLAARFIGHRDTPPTAPREPA